MNSCGRDRRPAFDALCRDAAKRQFDIVMAWSVDRLGRALMCGPKFVLLDEPSQGLAPVIVDIVIDTLVRLKSESIGILLVEQNAEVALDIADEASIIEQGEIVFRGSARQTKANEQIVSTYLSV